MHAARTRRCELAGWLPRPPRRLVPPRRRAPAPPAAASSLEQEYAHQQAVVVNQAYDVLKKPLRRAHYIVSLVVLLGWGGGCGLWLVVALAPPPPPRRLPASPPPSRALPPALPCTCSRPHPRPGCCAQLNQAGYGACEGMTITDPELLMSVMEAREEVEEAGDDRARLQPLHDRIWRLHDACVEVRGTWGRGWRAGSCRQGLAGALGPPSAAAVCHAAARPPAGAQGGVCGGRPGARGAADHAATVHLPHQGGHCRQDVGPRHAAVCFCCV